MWKKWVNGKNHGGNTNYWLKFLIYTVAIWYLTNRRGWVSGCKWVCLWGEIDMGVGMREKLDRLSGKYDRLSGIVCRGSGWTHRSIGWPPIRWGLEWPISTPDHPKTQRNQWFSLLVSQCAPSIPQLFGQHFAMLLYLSAIFR